MLKNTRYNAILPQMRNNPPVFFDQHDSETKEIFKILRSVSDENTAAAENKTSGGAGLWPACYPGEPKRQREKIHSKAYLSANANDEARIVASKVEQYKEDPFWQPHEKEMVTFWQINNSSNDSLVSQESGYGRKLHNDLLKQPDSKLKEPFTKIDPEDSLKRPEILRRHSVNCPKENVVFASLRQIYPNKEIGGLWDLFIKCNADIDWVVDILLREDEIMSNQTHLCSVSLDKCANDFQCNCSTVENTTANIPEMPTTSMKSAIVAGVKPQRQRVRSLRCKQRSNPMLQEISETIASRFVVSEEKHPSHVRKLREKLRSSSMKSYVNAEVQTDLQVEDPVEDDVDTTEILEVTLGDNLIKQLRNLFQAEMETIVDHLPENIALNIFIPRSLAKELYILWVESAYNQIEEQRQQTLRDDENFARLLKNPKYENFSQSPGNIQELLDLEIAQQAQYSDQEDYEHIVAQQSHPTSLAAHLTQMKLCETFPDIPSETLIDFLSANNNNYDETVKVLCDSTEYPETIELQNGLQKQELQMNIERKKSGTFAGIGGAGADAKQPLSKPLLQPEEAKRLALHDFEEMRNLSAHHCQLKAECYQKAKEAIQKGNSAVAVYYSQIASLHKMKLDMYNHRAANCIMDVHKYTQNNPELLDLHYLHVLEAISCLDLFLDRHITCLRAASRSYKHVFIITGRGLHSAGGVSTIKNKVKTRLKERNLRWSEVNPGLLKVKLFSASRHSKNI